MLFIILNNYNFLIKYKMFLGLQTTTNLRQNTNGNVSLLLTKTQRIVT